MGFWLEVTNKWNLLARTVIYVLHIHSLQSARVAQLGTASCR